MKRPHPLRNIETQVSRLADEYRLIIGARQDVLRSVFLFKALVFGATLIAIGALQSSPNEFHLVLFGLVLFSAWLVEALMMAFYTSHETRALQIESYFATSGRGRMPRQFQIHSSWASRSQRDGFVGRVAAEMRKPIIALPYIVLIVAIVIYYVGRNQGAA